MKFLKTLIIVVATASIIFSCDSMYDFDSDTMPNHDTERNGAYIFTLDVDPSELDSLIGTTYLQWWNGTQKNYPGMTMSVMAWESTSSWGNFAMNDLGSLPRQAFNNSVSDAHRFMTITPWSNLYTTIGIAEEVLQMIKSGETVIDENGSDQTHRAEAFAHFTRGISYGWLARQFDQAIVYDPEKDHNAQQPDDFEFREYMAVLDIASEALTTAHGIATAHSFTLPEHWINGNALSNTDFAKLINSYHTRILAMVPRTWDERENLDWTKLKSLAENGIEEDFIVLADGQFWWNRASSLMQDPTWSRASYYLIGRTDESGRFDDWINTNPLDRNQFIMDNADARIQGGPHEFDGDGNLTDVPAGTDFLHHGPSPLPPARGTYFFSRYQHHRNNEMYINGFVGPMPHMRKAEMDMYIAEALLHIGGQNNEAADLINNTRVNRGGLDAVSGSDDWDALFNAMRYEYEIETYATAAGLPYFQKRSWGHLKGKEYGGLPDGTPVHFPIPANLFEILFMDPYTFGGQDDNNQSRDILRIDNKLELKPMN